MILTILFITLAVFSRLIPHVPNFSPLVAVALFSGVYFNKKHGYLLPLAMFVLSDLIIGLHNTVLFTWSTIIIIYFLGQALHKKKNVLTAMGFTFLSSFLFFAITNFGVWAMGWYPRTVQGLIQCYILAIPFFRTSLFADVLYVGVLFGAYEFFLRRRSVSSEVAS